MLKKYLLKNEYKSFLDSMALSEARLVNCVMPCQAKAYTSAIHFAHFLHIVVINNQQVPRPTCNTQHIKETIVNNNKYNEIRLPLGTNDHWRKKKKLSLELLQRQFNAVIKTQKTGWHKCQKNGC